MGKFFALIIKYFRVFYGISFKRGFIFLPAFLKVVFILIGISFRFEKRSNALTHRIARNALQRKEKLEPVMIQSLNQQPAAHVPVRRFPILKTFSVFFNSL